MLVRCLYASLATEPMTHRLLAQIVERSRVKNPGKGITGLLCVAGEIFIQVLEGGRDEVCDLYNTIVADPRHRQVRLLSYEEIDERSFGAWTMGQVNVAKVNPALLLKYFKRAALDPFTGSARATMSLLHELVATAAIVSREV